MHFRLYPQSYGVISPSTKITTSYQSYMPHHTIDSAHLPMYIQNLDNKHPGLHPCLTTKTSAVRARRFYHLQLHYYIPTQKKHPGEKKNGLHKPLEKWNEQYFKIKPGPFFLPSKLSKMLQVKPPGVSPSGGQKPWCHDLQCFGASLVSDLRRQIRCPKTSPGLVMFFLPFFLGGEEDVLFQGEDLSMLAWKTKKISSTTWNKSSSFTSCKRLPKQRVLWSLCCSQVQPWTKRGYLPRFGSRPPTQGKKCMACKAQHCTLVCQGLGRQQCLPNHWTHFFDS